MERRSFLGGLTAASFGVMLENSFTDPAQARTLNWGKFSSPRFFRDFSSRTFQETQFSCVATEVGRQF